MVTAACLMIRRGLFREIDGFDEDRLPNSYNDVDLCLRLRSRGYLVVYTPYARILHHESASRGIDVDLDAGEYMTRRWQGVLNGDPYDNSNLTLTQNDHSLYLARLNTLRCVTVQPFVTEPVSIAGLHTIVGWDWPQVFRSIKVSQSRRRGATTAAPPRPWSMSAPVDAGL